MLAWLEQFLIRYPELALFLVIAGGYWIGSFKIGAFSLGPVTGALFAGLAVGDFAHVPVSNMTKSFLFLLFLFGVGYTVGPQFAQAMKRDGLKPMLLAVVVCFTGLATALAECAFPRKIGAKVNLASHRLPYEFALFGEDASRVVLSCVPEGLARIKQVAEEFDLFADVLGETGGDHIEITLDGRTVIYATLAELNAAYERALEKALRTEPATALEVG